MKIIVTLKFYPSTKRQTYLIVSLNHNSAADHDKASMASANTAVIIFGGFVALVAVIFLFFILDCIKSYFNRQSIDITVSPTTIKDTWSNFKLTDLADDEDETRILVEEEMPMVSSSTFGDEFQTKTQECLVVILNDETRYNVASSVSMTLFLTNPALLTESWAFVPISTIETSSSFWRSFRVAASRTPLEKITV